ncbi:MAG TPA: hypothetical protein VK548_22465 [Candidatus Acidoferrum sp.]|nr:hypothetical protein [Candidatus Acidoferrum sp.]
MYLNVKQRGDYVATFRWIEVRLMEMLAAWVPTTPELEVKLVFGAHIWEAAQHADALGRRANELRLPLHDSLEPARAYVELLAEVGAVTDTATRIAALYDSILPGMDARYRHYVDQVDVLLDGPTVRIVERILNDTARMARESQELREEVPAVKSTESKWLEALRERDTRLRDVVGHRGMTPAVPVG